MPITIPAADLTGALVGTTGTVDFKTAGITADPSIQGDNRPTVIVYNDSGCGLQVNFITGGMACYIPAGGWKSVQITAGESGFKYTVIYVLPNPPVSKLLTEYYGPSENPNVGTLGNSPVGIGGSVTTANVQTLVNDGNPTGTQIIESTPSGAASSTISVSNDGSLTVKTNNAGTLTNALIITAGASPTLTIGSAGLQVTVGGSLTVNTNASITGTLSAGASTLSSCIVSGTLSAGATSTTSITNTGAFSSDNANFTSDASGNVTDVTTLSKQFIHKTGTGSGTAGLFGKDSGGTQHVLAELLNLDNDFHLYTTPANKKLKISKNDFSGDILTVQDTSGLTMNQTGAAGNIAANTFSLVAGGTPQYTLLNSSISRLSTFTGTGTGTYNHGLGASPNIVLCNTNVAGSQTYGFDSVTSTQVHITCGAALGFTGFCYHT